MTDKTDVPWYNPFSSSPLYTGESTASRVAASSCAILSVNLYWISFFMPVLGPLGGEESGIFAFIICLISPLAPMLGDLAPFMFMGWLANPLLWASLYFLARAQYQKACFAAAIATVLAAIIGIVVASRGPPPLAFGYFMWLSSMPLMTIAAAINRHAEARLQRRPKRGLCAWCGYDLRATPERCPECGHIAAPRPRP
jgi:hypothetical protein